MGWSSGYYIIEQQVLAAYNLGKLDKDLLSALMEPFGNKDVDLDFTGEVANDGKDFLEIIVTTWGYELPEKPSKKQNKGDDYADYRELLYEKAREIMAHFNW